MPYRPAFPRLLLRGGTVFSVSRGEVFGFTGNWERNVEQSDDARAMMREAMEQMDGELRVRGNAVFIEEKMERGKLDRKFELSPDDMTMVATSTVKFGRMMDPVIIKTVYERTSE